MVSDLSVWSQVIFIVGEITVIVILGVILFAFLLVGISLYSIHRGRPFFPRFLKAGMVLLEGVARVMFRIFGLEDREVLTFFIQIQNAINKGPFEAVPVEQRAVFFPQCLRSSRCPAHLTPEGLKCQSCGQCSLGYWRKVLEQLGYKVFIVPGSSFIKRMVKKYHPKAIIGVGCLTEVKEGLEMADKIGLIPMGVVTTREGCVETDVNWDDVMEVALLGIERSKIPEEVRHCLPA
jgi:hypothetical protein